MDTPVKIAEKDKAPDCDIANLRQWLTTQPHLPPVPDNMLHLFYHSCYGDLSKTKDCIDVYYTIRSSMPEVFKERDISDKNFARTVENTLNADLPENTPEGYHVIFQRVESPDCSKYNFEETCKIFFMGLDSYIHREGIVPGFQIVVDYKYVRLGHLAKTSIGNMRKMFKYIQEGLPIRLKAIHMINMNYFIEKVMAFIKPFMHKELYNLIHFYPEGELGKLNQFVPIKCLPSEYGGEAGSCKALYDQFILRNKGEREYFKTEEVEFPVNEKLRPSSKKGKKNKAEPADTETVISLNKLEID